MILAHWTPTENRYLGTKIVDDRKKKSCAPEARSAVVPKMRLGGAVVRVLLLELSFSLTLVGHASARKSSAGRRAKAKPKSKAELEAFDLQASISGAAAMPGIRYAAPATARRGVPRPSGGSPPFFPSMLGEADEVSQQQFLSEYWGRKACLVRAGDAAAEPRFSLTMADVQVIIRDNPKSMVAGAGFKFASNGAILGKNLKGKVVDVDTALDGYSQGATIVINDIAALWPALTAHKDRMEDELRIPISANLYLTPEGERGFNPHYDMDDTFILQLDGVKEWLVWDAGGWAGEDDALTTSPLRDQREHMHDTPPDTVPRRHFVMKPGDVLYVPRGVSHVAATTAESPSLHITFAVHALCWEHYLRFLFAPGGSDDPTRAPFQLSHHAWAAAASAALAEIPPLRASAASLTSSLRGRFVKCKASKTGGKHDISVGMALQWWLHDVASREPAFRSAFSWYWPWEQSNGGGDSEWATALGKQRFAELIALLRNHAEEEEEGLGGSVMKRRMKALGCNAPSAEESAAIREVAEAVLSDAEQNGEQ